MGTWGVSILIGWRSAAGSNECFFGDSKKEINGRVYVGLNTFVHGAVINMLFKRWSVVMCN